MTPLAREVIWSQQGAVKAAFLRFQECRQANPKAEGKAQASSPECTDLWKLLPRILGKLNVEAERGDPEAAMMLAKVYFDRFKSAAPEYRRAFIPPTLHYASIAASNFSSEVEEIRLHIAALGP